MANEGIFASARRAAVTLADRVAQGARTLAGRVAPGQAQGRQVGIDGMGDPSVLAPWPQVDRYPIVLGPNAGFQYVSAAKRQAKFGYRLQWVDLLEELIEKDPSAYGNLSNRILSTAGGRIEVKSASKNDELADAVRSLATPDGKRHPRADEVELADEIARHVQAQVNAIPELPQALVNLLWGIYYGPMLQEIIWDRRPEGWRVKRLHFIAARRVSFPDQANYHPHLWDQGLVTTAGPGWQNYLSSGLFGIDILDYPNKFISYHPHVVSGYPQKDGLGMLLAWYLVLKAMAVRGGGEYIERFVKPWALATYASSYDDQGKKSRNATPEDIEAASAAMQALGLSGLSFATLPDSIDVKLFGPGTNKGGGEGKLAQTVFADWIDDQVARAILTTSAMQQLKATGARNALEVLARGAKRVYWFDSVVLAAALTRDLGDAIVRLNYPGKEHLAPTLLIHTDDEPSPEVMLDRYAKAAQAGFPIDADKAASHAGLADVLADPENADARILYPVKALDVLPPQKPTDLEAVEETTDEDESTKPTKAEVAPEKTEDVEEEQED